MPKIEYNVLVNDIVFNPRSYSVDFLTLYGVLSPVSPEHVRPILKLGTEYNWFSQFGKKEEEHIYYRISYVNLL